MAHISDYNLPSGADFPPQLTQWQLEPKRAALLIHNMQCNLLDAYTSEGALVSTLLRNLQRLRKWAHENDVPVLYSTQQLEANDGCPFLMQSSTTQPPQIIQALTPAANETLFSKTRYSSFNGTELLARLHSAKREQLLIAGLDAYGGCLVTALEAFNHGLQSFLVADAMLANNFEEHQRALQYVASRCGQLLETAYLASDTSSQLNRDWLHERVLQLIDDEELIDPKENLIFYGLDSLQVMKIASELKDRGIAVTFDELARAPTLANWWALIDSRQANA